MNTKNTVLVVGAGASKEANLPTGYELKKAISNLLDIRFDDWGKQIRGDHVIKNAFRLLAQEDEGLNGDFNPYIDEAHHIRDALPLAISIDNFIDNHRGNNRIATCGKLSIVQSILEAERKSLLYFEVKHRDSSINFNALETTWYLSFFQLLTENCEKNDLQDRFQSVTLIIFNYDRCVEHFIYHALQKFYKVDKTEASDLVESLNIFHPYGSVGSLPWQPKSVSTEFGAKPNEEKLLQLIKRIKTFTEGTDPDSSEILAIRNHMRSANKLVFMGFAFHELNMELIAPGKHRGGKSTPECYATAYEISQSDSEVIAIQINRLYSAIIESKIIDKTCGGFFKEFRRSLAF